MEGSHIILSRQDSSTDATLAISGTKQQKYITGVVTDVKGESLIGVTVMLKGTTQGTVTENNGKFSVVGNIGDMLIISYVGYVSQTIKIRIIVPCVLSWWRT